MKFQKNIFQIWFQGYENITKNVYVQNIENWKSMNKGWNHFCLNDANLRDECAKYSNECLQTYDSFDIMHLKIDFGRYVTLYNNGGMYVDVDSYILRPLDMCNDLKHLINLHEKYDKHILGLSAPKLNLLESYFVVQKSIMINNGIMFSSAKNPDLKGFIDFIIETAKIKDYTHCYLKVNYLTGPAALNQYIENCLLLPSNNIIHIFDYTIFEPCVGEWCKITDDTISIHVFCNSWLPKYMQDGKKLYYDFKGNTTYILIILIIMYVLYTMSNRSKKYKFFTV